MHYQIGLVNVTLRKVLEKLITKHVAHEIGEVLQIYFVLLLVVGVQVKIDQLRYQQDVLVVMLDCFSEQSWGIAKAIEVHVL